MGRHDWYRNEEWNEEIEAQFFAKLSRARDKHQYLRIQACTLAASHPRIALMLLDRYFTGGDHFDAAQAYVDQAEAHLALGEVDDALVAYERALAREIEYPNLLTQAYLELPFLIATTGRTDRYEQALEILRLHHSRPTFPVERFKWHAAQALICAANGDGACAKRHARAALDHASAAHSGYRYHPSAGLVGLTHASLRERLGELA